jgi:U6 snRNA-associated Sm-like protein LSm5
MILSIHFIYCTKHLTVSRHSSSRQVNLVLDDAIEYSPDPKDKSKVIKTELKSEILLNGNQIAVLVPGGSGPPEDSLAANA